MLAKNVKEMVLEFWNPNRGEWADDWTQTNSLPKMVKVTLRFTSPNRRYGSSRVDQEITRIVALPSITVPVNWQMIPARRGGRR